MRRSRRIYKRKSRSNLETLVILIGAIIILSVAFYMAREKSFLPPEEMKSEQQDVFEEEMVQTSEADQEANEELSAQSSPASEVPSEQGTLEQPGVNEGEISEQPAEQSSQQDSGTVESQAINESAGQEQALDSGQESTVSGLVHTVQVGYFSVESNARRLATEIENRGFQTYLLKHNNAYKVQVGAYQAREQADRASLELKGMGYETWVTQR